MVSGTAEAAAPAGDVPADLKARLVLAALRGEPEPWNAAEARRAGVTPADVAAWQGVLAARAAQLFAPQGSETLASLRQERDALQVQLALRFDELAVLTRLLDGRSRLFPRVTKDRLHEMRNAVLDRRRQFAPQPGTLRNRIARTMPASWKARVRAMILRIRSQVPPWG